MKVSVDEGAISLAYKGLYQYKGANKQRRNEGRVLVVFFFKGEN